MTMGIDLLREWDMRNQARGWNEDMTLGEFLESKGFPVENHVGRFFGRDLNEPNSRSEFPVMENPVSISEMRRRGDLRVNRGIHYRDSTTEVLSSRARKAAEAPVENEQTPWEVEAMEYFKERLDEIHESMVRGMAVLMAEQQKLHSRIDALVSLVSESLDERSESAPAGVEVGNIITLYGVDADVINDLRSELDTRLARLIARKKNDEARR